MENIEKIDDYLTGKLSAADQADFEQRLAQDPALTREVTTQRTLIEGVRAARRAELKARLNNVSVPSVSGSSSYALKWAAGVVATGTVITGLYFAVVRDSQTTPVTETLTESVQTTPQIQPEATQPTGATADPEQTQVTDEVVAKAPQTSKAQPQEKPGAETKAAEKPTLNVLDPSDEVGSETTQTDAATLNAPAVRAAQMEVETDSSLKKYNFHYQFASGKLILYGSFDKSLYEILEVNGDSHALFLFHKNNYYLLDERQIKITELKAITDPTLLRLLKAYRQ
ncbi:MAG: hypothetical protein MUC38_07135 [Cyclobacteriaceae bacterium]|jgi:hypothetical protein|nr:hypothetical protein [Cyclobacteriaceae bacterium]